MKIKLLAFFALAVALCAAADAPPSITVADNIVIIQTAPASGSVSAFWQKSTTVDGSTFTQPLVENAWKLADTGTVSITLADGTKAVTTRANVFVAVVAIATEEHATQAAK